MCSSGVNARVTQQVTSYSFCASGRAPRSRYRRSVGQERSDRLVAGHISVHREYFFIGKSAPNLFQLGDSRFVEEDEE